MAISLPRTSEGSVPYIERAIISAGGIVAHCPDCRKLTLPRWLTLQHQDAKGPEPSGWDDNRKCQLCHDCLDRFLSERADTHSVIHDYRDTSVSSA